MKRVRTESGDQGSAKFKHPFLSRVAAYVTYEETFGDSVEDQTIVTSIQSLPIEYWLRLASVGTIFLEHHEGKPDSQLVLLHYLFPERFADIWQTKYKDTQSVFFHRTQFIALYRLALLYAKAETSGSILDNEHREAVARCLLGINSLIHKTLIAERDSSFNFGTFVQKLYSNFREPLTTYEQSYLMSYLQAYWNQTSENLGYIVGRYKEMLFDIPDDSSFLPAGLPRDLFSTTLQQQTGLSVVDYTALTFGIIAKYISVDSIFKKEFHFPISKKNHFSKSSIDANVVNRFWDLISQSHSEFLKAETTTKNLTDSITNFRNLMLKPAVNLDASDDLYPASLVFLQRLLTLGGTLFWIATGNKFMGDLRGWLGEVFEFYCGKICTKIEKTASIRPKYFPELEYGRPGVTKKSCDAILIYKNSAVMMEFKIKSPKLVPTIIDGCFDSLIQDINEAFIGSADGDKAAKQIHNTIHDIRTGELSLKGIDPRSITTYYPVIVTFQPWPLGPFVYDLIRREIYNAGLLRLSCCAPVEIWGCEEFESIESVLVSKSVAPVDTPTLLREKLFSTYRSLTMATFLWDKYQRGFPANDRLSAAREEMFRLILSTLSLSQ